MLPVRPSFGMPEHGTDFWQRRRARGQPTELSLPDTRASRSKWPLASAKPSRFEQARVTIKAQLGLMKANRAGWSARRYAGRLAPRRPGLFFGH